MQSLPCINATEDSHETHLGSATGTEPRSCSAETGAAAPQPELSRIRDTASPCLELRSCQSPAAEQGLYHLYCIVNLVSLSTCSDAFGTSVMFL
jgi:hypothetical protein